ncbi:hypothetical protein N431DRAFT_525909 [Stipitochalara longipes BDJ]|nr:hypothetical protein N431DRAFT_525909 [Stipitochalara longipes BDJ]
MDLNLGDGVVETVLHGYELDFGIWAPHDPGEERARLRISNGLKAQYAALSYCWGSTRQLSTTEEILKPFTEEEIEMKKLTQTLQDAFMFISMMPQIYEGAAVTLSAASASACSPGFLEDRAQVRDVLDDSFPLPCALKETGQTSVEDILENFAKKSIDQRAWTLQESWLAPRLLIYGSAPLQWQCLSAGYWAEYTCREMTDVEDKLPALSGLAAEFGRPLDDEYLAGLWKSTLPYSLLWYQVSERPTSPSSTYRAPLWSWASIDGRIRFETPTRGLQRRR